MTIAELNMRKKELGYSYRNIAELSGVPLSTVQKILGGFVDTPRYENLKAIHDVLGLPDGIRLWWAKCITGLHII